MSRSSAALLIALLLHLLIIAAFLLFGYFAPLPEPKVKAPEHRIRVSLQERPEAKRDALIKNDRPIEMPAPPMPKGKQLEKLVKKPLMPVPEKPHRTLEPVIAPSEPAPKPPKEVPLPKPETHIAVPKTPEDKLYSKLLRSTVSTQPEKEAQEQRQRQSRISEDIKEAYGDSFALLSAGEQKYILDNQEIMRRITQETLNRVASVSIPRSLRISSDNLVEFYLHPNGDITDLKLVKRSGFYKLDDTTVETIEYAYSRYPRPDQKTLIRFRFAYYLQGY
jgi:periplasmic protein TonB